MCVVEPSPPRLRHVQELVGHQQPLCASSPFEGSPASRRRPQAALGHVTRERGVLESSAMKLPVTLERDESGMIVAECPAIPGCVSQGQTEEEALANIREAIVACLEVRAEQGLRNCRFSWGG